MALTAGGHLKTKDNDEDEIVVAGKSGAGTNADPLFLDQKTAIDDGDDVAQGALADAAIITDTTGSLSGKLRGLVKWAFERMPASLGQKTKAASLPVTLASDEDAVNVASTVVDGGNVAIGTTTDAAETSDSDGTVIGFLRGLVAWAYVRMPASLGQKAKAASLPVTLASDEDAVNVASTVIDGGDVTQGDVDDAAVVTDTTGTLSGKIRGLVKWAFERMPASLGQKAKAASLPVTLASDEDTVNVADAGPLVAGTDLYTTSADATTAIDISAAAAGGEFRKLLQCTLSTDTAMNLTIQMETTPGIERRKFFLPANGSIIFAPRHPVKLGTAVKKWQVLASVAGNIAVSTTTVSEA